MKIALFTDQFYPELSGITDSVYMLGTALANRGHSVAFVAPRYPEREFDKTGRSFSEPDYGANITTIRLPSTIYPNSPTGQSRITIPLGPLGSALSQLKKFKPDIIHTNSPFGAGIEALIAAKLTGIPLVGTNHTPIIEFMAYSPFHPKWFVELFVRFYSWYYNRCAFVSAPCNALLEDMTRHGFKKTGNERQAIANPVPLEAYFPSKNAKEKAELKKRFGFSPHTILFNGRLATEKNADLIIRAVVEIKKEFPDVFFAVTGHGSAEQSLKKLTVELGLEKHVLFMGYVSSAILPSIYRAGDIFPATGTAETQCISLMKAFSCGIPAIVVRAWGLPEYTDSRAGIMIEPGDLAALVKNILELFRNPKRMEEMGIAGVESVRRYSPEAVAEKWEKIYEKYAHAKQN